MDGHNEHELPIHGQSLDDSPKEDEASCSPKVYVSNEESALVDRMRDLKERADEIRGKLAAEPNDDERRLLEADLEELREQWTELSGRREAAYRRKMVMLGHLPPDTLF
jgi:hypothetical protein